MVLDLVPGLARSLAALAPAIVLCLAAGCASEPPAGHHGSNVEAAHGHAGGAGWSVTAWGRRFEVFPEVEALVVGQPAEAHVHVTRLDGFSAFADGAVELVLRPEGGGAEQIFRAPSPDRPGVFSLDLRPATVGTFELEFRLRDVAGEETVRGGKVRVGDAASPGGVAVAPAPRGATDAAQPVPFLKEEQWRSAGFATEWVRRGRLARSVGGSARVRPPAGGEAEVAAPVAGVLRAALSRGAPSWPFVGRRVRAGEALLRIVPRVAPEASLASLGAASAALAAELESARARLGRLEELISLEAVSRREVEEAALAVKTLEAPSAARKSCSAAEGARAGLAGGADGPTLKAPFDGEIAAVDGAPGSGVEAGQTLLRVVRTDRAWLEIAVAPSAARAVEQGGVRGVVLEDPELGPSRLEDGVRQVSVAPETSPETGTVTVRIEVPGAAVPALGTTLDARILLAEETEGLVIPSTALVDDGGVPVVYLQLAGETFVRQQVRVVERQGERVLVDGLRPGQRLVSGGGEAVRRAGLMSGGAAAHGHVH